MSGFGVYPGDPCYDQDRPTWLPYWLDDFTESDCKWGASNIAGATVNAFENPGQVGENVGGVVGQGAGAAVSDIADAIAAAGKGAAQSITFGGGLLVIGGALVAFAVLGNFFRK